MRTFLLTALIGVVAGTIDILPMIKMKLDKYAISSAFIFYFAITFIIVNTRLFKMPWWLNGAVIALVLAIPVIITVAKTDKSSIPPMVIMSIVLGTLISAAGHFFIKMPS